MTFLIADDSQRFRQLVTQHIQENIPNHHQFYEAGDGREAASLYEQVHPDWVLMDIAMEPVDGLAGSRAILSTHPEARIIILTNYDDPDYHRVAKETGTSAFILKEHLRELITMLSPPPSRSQL